MRAGGQAGTTRMRTRPADGRASLGSDTFIPSPAGERAARCPLPFPPAGFNHPGGTSAKSDRNSPKDAGVDRESVRQTNWLDEPEMIPCRIPPSLPSPRRALVWPLALTCGASSAFRSVVHLSAPSFQSALEASRTGCEAEGGVGNREGKGEGKGGIQTEGWRLASV